MAARAGGVAPARGAAPARGLAPWAVELTARLHRAGPAAFACRRSAAALLALDGFGPGEDGWTDVPELGVARGRHAAPGVHRHLDLGPQDLTVVDGLPVLAAPRVLVELGTVAGPDRVEWALEAALRQGLVDLQVLTDPRLVARRPGGPVLRQVLQCRPPGAPPTGSLAETRFLQVCRAGGLPDPVRQHPVPLDRSYRLDAAWVPERVGAEVDGRAWHGPERLQWDLRRQNAIVLDRWLLLRFTWGDIVHRPERVVAQIRAALGGTRW